MSEWTWPTPGVRTWQPPAVSFFGSCTGRLDCDTSTACPVGRVTTVDGGPYGCDCPCHDEREPR